jgi:hypothetical protein
MKIRTGFVSNSSSSSFICVICGEEASGWDMGLSEADMFECENGHTCCNSHKLKKKDPSIKQMREYLINEANESDYYKGKPTVLSDRIEEINNLDDTEIEDEYNDAIDCAEPACNCPVCQFKKLTLKDGYSFLKNKYGLNDTAILEEMKSKFKTYDDFTKNVK